MTKPIFWEKNIISLLSVEFLLRVVKVNVLVTITANDSFFFFFFLEKIRHDICCELSKADNSQEVSYFFWQITKIKKSFL